MKELEFEVVGIEVEPYAAAPTLSLGLRITETSGSPVDALVLRAQVRIEPQRRRYTSEEEGRLEELFGAPSQWTQSLRPFQWTELSTAVGRFEGSTEVTLPLECTYDLEVVATKYLHNLRSGEVPLVLLFSGTTFYSGRHGMVVQPVPWHLEARYRLPVARWREAMDRYFPNSAWLRLSRETLDALGAFKTRQALPTWDQAVELLLKRHGGDEP